MLYLIVALFAPDAFRPPINAIEHVGAAESIYFSFMALTGPEQIPGQPAHCSTRMHERGLGLRFLNFNLMVPADW